MSSSDSQDDKKQVSSSSEEDNKKSSSSEESSSSSSGEESPASQKKEETPKAVEKDISPKEQDDSDSEDEEVTVKKDGQGGTIVKKGDAKDQKSKKAKHVSKGKKRKSSFFSRTPKAKVDPEDISPAMTPEMWAKVKEKDLYPIQLRFENLSFSVPIKQKRGPFSKCKKGDAESNEIKWKTILNNLTGTFNPGTLTAIMGSSGAGKTTLLNVLAHRAVGKVEGDVLYNGNSYQNAKSAVLKHQAYVMQDDIMMKTQTALEILTFSANLRIPPEYTSEQKKARVQQLIDELNLGSCANTQVGAPGEKRGVSGGERKRIAIGMELVTNPSLLFLDEPTSGLDSFTAERVIETLRVLAESGRTIICTIHQPNSNIFHKFDQLILLAKGEMVFNGPAKYAITYFNGLGHQCPPFTNPSDYFMKLIHIEQSSETGDATVKELIQSYKDSDLAQKQKKAELREVPIEQVKEVNRGYAQPMWKQTQLLMKRNFSDILREPLKVRASLGQTIFLGVLLGLIYLRLGRGQSTIQDRTGSLFFLMVNQAMTSVSGIVNIFPAERVVFTRENSARMYQTTAYYWAKILMDLPFQILYPVVFGAISYWMIGFQADAAKFFIFLTCITLVANVGSGIGLLLGILAKDAGVAVALVPVTVIPFIIFSGFLINTDNVPKYFIWLEYASFIKYGFRCLAVNEFDGLVFECAEDEKVGGSCRIPNGTTELKLLGFDGQNPGVDLLILLGMFVFWRIITYLALLWRAKTSAANA